MVCGTKSSGSGACIEPDSVHFVGDFDIVLGSSEDIVSTLRLSPWFDSPFFFPAGVDENGLASTHVSGNGDIRSASFVIDASVAETVEKLVGCPVKVIVVSLHFLWFTKST